MLNGWKAEVLADLYDAAAEVLTPGVRHRVEERRNAMRIAVWKLMGESERDDGWYKRQFAGLPESFVTSQPPGAVLDALRNMRALAGGRAFAWGEDHSEHGTVELMAAVDEGKGRGVFSSMAGALSAAGLQIIAAETTLLPDGLLVLRYLAEDPAALAGELHIPELCNKMIASIGSDAPPKFPRVWGAEANERNAALTNLPNEVRLDADLSDQWLIVEVFTTDRLGLLYELARALHEMQLVIRFAKIATSADQVVDVFYVAERDESKPTGDQRLEEIRNRMLAIVEPEA